MWLCKYLGQYHPAYASQSCYPTLQQETLQWQERLGSQRNVIQSLCTWTSSRTSYSSFLLVLYLLSCPSYPHVFLCGCIALLYLVFRYGLYCILAQAGIKSCEYLKHGIAFPILSLEENFKA